MIENGLWQWILANDEIDALLPAGGLFMGLIPESAPPLAMMFKKITGKHDTTLDGPSGYVERRYQFTIKAADLDNELGSGYVIAVTLADVLRQQLNGLTGTLPDGTLLFNAILDLELDDYDADALRYVEIQDYLLTFRQDP